MNAACLQNLLLAFEHRKSASSNSPSRTEHFDSDQSKCSVILSALSTCYDSLSSFSENKKVSAYAGGGVRCPTPICESFNFTRNIGFPLCQEMLLAGIDTSITKMISVTDTGSDFNEEKSCLDASLRALTLTTEVKSEEEIEMENRNRHSRMRRNLTINKRYQVMREQLDSDGALTEWITKVDPTRNDWMATKYVNSIFYS